MTGLRFRVCPRCGALLSRRVGVPGWVCLGCGHDETDAGAPLIVDPPARPVDAPVEPAAGRPR